MSAKWLTFWRVLAAIEIVGFLASALVAATSFAALHVTWIALAHDPNLLLSSGVTFVTAALVALALCAGLLLTIPFVLIGEWAAWRDHRRDADDPIPPRPYFSPGGLTREYNDPENATGKLPRSKRLVD